MEEWYKSLPVVTRTWTTAALAATFACYLLPTVSPMDLWWSGYLSFTRLQLWRVVTNFLYFGPPSFDLVFHLFFLVRYCRQLEAGSFRGRTADMVWMLVLGGATMLAGASAWDYFSPSLSGSPHMPFLAGPLSFMLVCVDVDGDCSGWLISVLFLGGSPGAGGGFQGHSGVCAHFRPNRGPATPNMPHPRVAT